MGLFDKKYCDICGDKIGLLGNRKLEDGNMCKDCAAQLSPWFSDRRRSTLDEIKAQLDYREANKAAVEAFRVTHVLGLDTKVMLDEDAGKLIITRSRKWQDENPDVIDFSQVTGCDYEVDESREELKREVNGRSESYNPPRYDYDYDFYVLVRVNSPWFSEIRFKVNSSRIDRQHSGEYNEAKRLAEEICGKLRELRQNVRRDIEQSNAPKTAVTCQWCGATTILDASGRCEYCGGASS